MKEERTPTIEERRDALNNELAHVSDIWATLPKGEGFDRRAWYLWHKLIEPIYKDMPLTVPQTTALQVELTEAAFGRLNPDLKTAVTHEG